MTRYDNEIANSLYELGYGMTKRQNVDIWAIDLLGIPCGKLNIPKQIWQNPDYRPWKDNIDYLTLNISDSRKRWFSEIDNTQLSIGWYEWIHRIKINISIQEKEDVIPTIKSLSSTLGEYIFSVEKPKNFNRYGKARLNKELLPFFLAGYSQDETNFALKNDLVPSDYGFVAFQQNRLDEFGGLEVINNLPEDILHELLAS
jgi:hypothetical protein